MLLLERTRPRGFWQSVTGSLEWGEGAMAAARREVFEETGLVIRPRRRVWTCTTAWKVELAWWLAEMDDGQTPAPNPPEVASIHWMTAAEMAATPRLLDSNRIFLDMLARGEVCLV